MSSRLSHRQVCGADRPKQLPQAATEGTQLSFAEVMQLVQEGKEVPGVRKLEVKPSYQSPTPSQMERLQKPWETSSASDCTRRSNQKYTIIS
uniref:Peroxisomal membrane protein PEX14-like KPWE domain-containing protein n=1 Tax=Takifugu rubripes TaxID=31033 RepID=A0A3B5KL05_TAKRU